MGRTDDWRLSEGDLLDDLPRERTTDPLSTVLGSLVGTFSVLSMAWMVILGFVGGAVPVVGWQLSGGIGGGLAWLMVVASLGVVALWVLPLMLSMVAYAGLSRVAPALSRAVKRPTRTPLPRPDQLRRAA